MPCPQTKGMERTGFEQWKPREVARLLALVETERRYYQEMMAALPAALVVLAHDRAVLSANVAFRRLVGLSGEDLRKRTIDQILPSDELIERLRAAHVSGDTAPFLINMGQRRFRMAAAPIRGWQDDMEPETLLLVETVEPGAAPPSETAPVALPAEASPIVASAPVLDLAPAMAALPNAVWQADASTFAFTYVGGAAEEILGYPASHWLAEPSFFSERIHPEDRAAVMALYRSTISTGGEASAEFRVMHQGSRNIWCRETLRVPAPGEGARLISGVLSPIGERRQLEAQSLTAARVDALRGLSSRLAHDLNNPLMIVTGYSEEMMHALPDNDPMRNDLGEVLSAGGRMTDLAGHLLGFTRPLAKASSKIDLSERIAVLKPKLLGAIDLETASPEGVVWAYADAEQLDDAIDALAARAIENTTEVSRLRVECATSRISELVESSPLQPGVYSRLDIQAMGKGGGPSIGVFESILPAKDTREPDGPAVARAYLNVRQWGGDIVFSSSVESGSTFTIFLPYAEPDKAPEPVSHELASEFVPAEIAEPAPVPAPEPQPEPSLGTVLVVEDEPGIRSLVRKILKRERYDVLEAGNGEDALAAAAAHSGPIGLLLTDVILPGIGGREVAQTLVAARADIKVVYISGFTDDESVRAGEFPPGSMFLQKPFTLSSLMSAVKRAFESN